MVSELEELYRSGKWPHKITDDTFEIAERANVSLLNIAQIMQHVMHMKIGGSIQWRVHNGRKRAVKDYGDKLFPNGYQGVDHPAGLIRVWEDATAFEEIMANKDLTPYDFKLFSASDTRAGYEKRQDRGRQYVSHLSVDDLTGIEQEYDTINHALVSRGDYYTPYVSEDLSSRVDRVVLVGRDFQEISDARIYLVIGNETLPKLWDKGLPVFV